MIVGHVTVGGFTATDQLVAWSNWVHPALWTPLAVILALGTIQPFKAGVT
ncbi:DUF983 domain-containing protein [Pararhizobium sp.]